DDRRDRGTEAKQPTDEWNPVQRFRRTRHLAFAERTVDARERPEPLADDHDAVGPGHPAEAGQPRQRVGAGEEVEERTVHPLSIVKGRPPGNPPGGLLIRGLGPRLLLPAAAAEEAEQRQHENHDQNDPEN
ncbi:MAG: hypothetical protein QOI67_417, partial [Gaiellaceae bacterium]|nr:hypothetical protein [Gaiellaceae bacterium]